MIETKTVSSAERVSAETCRGRGAKRAHLVGIAGAGLRGLAGILVERGFVVSGSEAVPGPALDALAAIGVRCSLGHREENLPPDADIVVISAAVGEENPEVRQARRLGIAVVKYAEFLGRLMADRTGIAVAGTHGKTTTTAMVAQVLGDLGEEPGFIVGGEYPPIGGCSSWGSGRYFVAEACEFDRSFLNLFPACAIVTNVDEDHLDCFGGLGEIQGAFADFVGHLPRTGILVINADDDNSRQLRRRARARVRSFSLRKRRGNWWAEKATPVPGGISFVAVSRSGSRFPMRLPVPGIHNVKNALAVLTLVEAMGHPPPVIIASLQRFSGVKRRFEVLRHRPVTVVDDYAHHPTEIEMVLRAARETFPGRRLRVVFQPHQYSRTYRFLDGFAEVLSRADEITITDVFAARDSEEDKRRIDAQDLVRAIVEHGARARYTASFDAMAEFAVRSWLPGDVFLCLGAGDITSLAYRLCRDFQGAAEGIT